MSDPRDPADTPDPAGGGDTDPDQGLLDDIDTGEDPDDQPETPEADDFVDEDEPAPPPRQTRRQQQASWRDRAQRAEDRLAEQDRRFAELEARVAQPQPAVDPRQTEAAREAEYERISLLPPVEQIKALHRLMQNEAGTVSLQAAERADAQSFQALQERNGLAKRLAPKVEQGVRTLRAQGNQWVTREAVFKYMLGEEVMNRSAAGTAPQRRAGAARVARETTRPASGRGDVGGRSRSNGVDADEALLRTTRISDNPW